MRGSLIVVGIAVIVARIIPAHAGLTARMTSLSPFPRDHPRACGAHKPRWLLSDSAGGSSPRMRGSPIYVSTGIEIPGIIPAHAGLTLQYLRRAGETGDHPRACGAHVFAAVCDVAAAGSSPRMRGSRFKPLTAISFRGIIPAHAGLTPKNFSVNRCFRDHPRACGAHQKI